jgi:hypothetical protein
LGRLEASRRRDLAVRKEAIQIVQAVGVFSSRHGRPRDFPQIRSVGDNDELIVGGVCGNVAEERTPIGLTPTTTGRCVLWNVAELLDVGDCVDRSLIGEQELCCLVRTGESAGGDAGCGEVDTEICEATAENGSIGDRHRLPVF